MNKTGNSYGYLGRRSGITDYGVYGSGEDYGIHGVGTGTASRGVYGIGVNAGGGRKRLK